MNMYQSSKGPIAIDTMPLSYAKNALAKIQRDETQRHRTAEIGWLVQHIRKLEADAPASEPDRGIGGNNPPPEAAMPKLDGRSAIEAHADDLLLEAANWADGFVIENQTQADTISTLLRKLQDAAKLVDDGAAKEKKPLNDAINEIGAWQNGYTAKGLKKTPDGKLTKAILATGNMTTAWLRKLDDERRAREQETAAAAHKAAQEAIEARAEAKAGTDLAAMDTAEDMLSSARNLLKEAEGVAKEKVRTGGGDGFRAVGLRSVWSAEITDQKAALLHYIKTYPEDFCELVQSLANRDARNEATRRETPGVKFNEERIAA